MYPRAHIGDLFQCPPPRWTGCPETPHAGRHRLLLVTRAWPRVLLHTRSRPRLAIPRPGVARGRRRTAPVIGTTSRRGRCATGAAAGRHASYGADPPYNRTLYTVPTGDTGSPRSRHPPDCGHASAAALQTRVVLRAQSSWTHSQAVLWHLSIGPLCSMADHRLPPAPEQSPTKLRHTAYVVTDGVRDLPAPTPDPPRHLHQSGPCPHHSSSFLCLAA